MQAPAATDDLAIPSYLKRSRDVLDVVIEADKFDQDKWLDDLTAEFGKCLDFVSFDRLQKAIMSPAQRRVTSEAWTRATLLAGATASRILRQISDGHMVAAE
jgi:hypothetical protein